MDVKKILAREQERSARIAVLSMALKEARAVHCELLRLESSERVMGEIRDGKRRHLIIQDSWTKDGGFAVLYSGRPGKGILLRAGVCEPYDRGGQVISIAEFVEINLTADLCQTLFGERPGELLGDGAP